MIYYNIVAGYIIMTYYNIGSRYVMIYYNIGSGYIIMIYYNIDSGYNYCDLLLHRFMG